MSRKVIYAFDCKFRVINPWVEFDGRLFILKQGGQAKKYSSNAACKAGIIRIEPRAERRVCSYEEFVAQRNAQSASRYRSAQECCNY
jgi:hypothetical protein